MPFKVRSYKRLENRDTIEVNVQNTTFDLGGLIHIRGREHGVYFNGKLCYVPRLCQIMDETECDGMTLEVVDGKSFYFTLDESVMHSWTTGCPDNLRLSVKRNAYVEDEFSLTVDHLIDSKSRANGTYFGDKMTRVYLNGNDTSTFPGIFLEGNRVKKLVWHWHYCATMDKYVKWLSEVWFVNAEILKERSDVPLLVKSIIFDADAGVKCRITRVDKDYQWMCHFVYLIAVDNTGKEHCYTFKIPDNSAFNIIGGKRSDLDSWITFSKWHVKSITYMPNPNGYDVLMSMRVVDREDVYTVPNPKYDINVLKARLDINLEDTKYGIKPVEFIPYDPSEFEFKPNNNKEEIKMSKTIKEVWDSMTREQQDACCFLIGEAIKKNPSLDYEIKRKVAAIKAGEYMIRVKGTDIRDIIFNGPATIILWRDGSKTVIKLQKGDRWDPEKAVAMAVMKKVFGTNETGSNYLEFVKPYIEKALEGHKGCEETKKDPADELVEMAQDLIVEMTYKGATKAELVRAIKYSKELIDWLKTPAGGYVKTGSPTELLEKYGIAELRKKYQKG